MFFVYGTGANGKSVFLSTITGLMADYAVTAPIGTFTASKSERHPTDLAGFQGARLVTAVEVEEGRQWDESKLKTLTGGDRIAARFMWQDFFHYIPQFKVCIAGNHKPELRTVDEAIRRRFHLLPFAVTIPPKQRDLQLADKLRQEWPGILEWMIEGCLEWQKQGLVPPASVRKATEDYLTAEDTMGRWLEECCVVGNQIVTAVAMLFASWKRWCNENGEACGSQKAFSQKLSNRRFSSGKHCGKRSFQGLGLLDDSME